MTKKNHFAIGIIAFFIISAAVFFYMLSGFLQNKGDIFKSPEETGILKDAVLLEKLKTDNSKNAEESLLKLSSNQDAAGYMANIYLADRYSNSGKDAVLFLRRALDLYDTKDIEMRLATCLLNQGSLEEAAKIYGSLLPDKKVLDILLNLEAEPLVIGRILLESNQSQAASDFLKTAILNTNADGSKDELESLYSKALVESGNYKDALPLLKRMQELKPQDLDIKWLYGRSLEATAEINKAKEIYASIGSKGAYRLGLLLEKEGKLNAAADAFLKGSQDDSIWRGANIYDELGNTNRAIEGYNILSKTQGIYKDDAAYRAFILIKKSTGKEDPELLNLIAKYPSWMVRLNKEQTFDTFVELSYGKPDFLNRYEAYRESGRNVMADIELSIGKKNADLSSKLALGDWYLSLGSYAEAAEWGMKAIKDQPVRHAFELAYQRPFNEAVLKEAAEFNLAPNLIWALIREESSFKSDAVSRAGALGLTQLMPPTAMDISSQLKLKVTEKDLLKPDINIRFGAYYLSSMLARFSGDIDKALAAYNGGAGNVKRWSQNKIGSTKEGFPTSVSFLETREYITKVRNSYYMYEMLYGEIN